MKIRKSLFIITSIILWLIVVYLVVYTFRRESQPKPVVEGLRAVLVINGL